MTNLRTYLVAFIAFSATFLPGPPALAAAPADYSSATPGFNGTVLAVAYSGSTLYVGGNFTSAVVKGKSYPRSRLAAVDANTGELLPWAPAANARVKAIAVNGSAVYVAGEFSTVAGQQRDSLARIDGSSGAVASSFKHAIDGKPYALAIASGRLYMGGTFTAVNGQSRSRLAAFSLSTGALDSSWKPTADDQIETLATGNGRIYAGGKFHKINTTSGYDRLAALDPSSGALVTGFKPKPPVIVYGIAVTSDGVYTASGGQGGSASAYTLTGSRRWTATFDGDAQAVTVVGDTVYVGGHFDHTCMTARTGSQGVCSDGAATRIKIAGFGAAEGALRPWQADMNGVEGVLTMTAGAGGFAAGGAFTIVHGVAQKRLAQFR